MHAFYHDHHHGWCIGGNHHIAFVWDRHCVAFKVKLSKMSALSYEQSVSVGTIGKEGVVLRKINSSPVQT